MFLCNSTLRDWIQIHLSKLLGCFCGWEILWFACFVLAGCWRKISLLCSVPVTGLTVDSMTWWPIRRSSGRNSSHARWQKSQVLSSWWTWPLHRTKMKCKKMDTNENTWPWSSRGKQDRHHHSPWSKTKHLELRTLPLAMFYKQFKYSRQVLTRNLVHGGTVLGTEVTIENKTENFFS